MKFQVNIEETTNYLILVEADDEESAEQMARDHLDQGGVDFADHRSEVYEVLKVADDVPGPFPRAEDDLKRETFQTF